MSKKVLILYILSFYYFLSYNNSGDYMIKVIKNGTVITMNNKRKQYEKVDIVIKDDSIIDIVDNYNGEYDELIDATNKIVMPGLINCHTHLGMSIFRATNDNLTLTDWLNIKIWPIENKMTDEDIYYTTLLSCIEMIKTGTVMANNMYFSSGASLKAIKESFVRGLIGNNLIDNDGHGEDRLNELVELYTNNSNPLIKFAVAPHSLYTCSKDYLKKCSDLALQYNLPLHIHFCENENEIDEIIKNYGMSPVRAIESLGFLRNKLILAHATFLNDDGLKMLKDYDVSISHNPISNLNLGCGIADITKYRQYVNVCLGTDGQGSGNNMNLFYHMSVVDLLQKGIYKNPTVYSSYDTLKMATINGAKALGIEDMIGSIEIGKKADIIILDMNNIEAYPTDSVITQVVHNTESCNVDTTIINGKVLMKNHKLLLDINEDDLKSKVDDILKRLKI